MSLEDDAQCDLKNSAEEEAKFQTSVDPTIMGRKLRIMTVEKGLLRETKVVQKLLDALVERRVSSDSHPWAVPWSSYSHTQSYMDNLEDLLATAALRMLVKDFLILFQAVNEGIISVLGKGRD